MAERSRVTVSSDGPVVFSARATCDDAESELGCSPPPPFGQPTTLLLDEVPPGDLFIVVDPIAAEPFEVQIDVASLVRACNDEIDNDGDGLIDWPDDPQCPSAGGPSEAAACDLIEPLARLTDEGIEIAVDTRGHENHYESTCAGSARGGEEVIALTLTRPSRVVAETVRAQYDTALHIRGECDDAATLIQCDDDGGESTMSRISRELPPGTYYIFVDGFGDRTGQTDFVLTVDSLIVACNDEIDNDADGRVDRADPGCESARDENDDDGLIDWPADPGCPAAGGPHEEIIGGRVLLCDEGAPPPEHEGICGVEGDPETSYFLDFETGAKVPPADLDADLSKGHVDCCDFNVHNGATQVDTGLPAADFDQVACGPDDQRAYAAAAIPLGQPSETVICVRTGPGGYFKYIAEDACCADLGVVWASAR